MFMGDSFWGISLVLGFSYVDFVLVFDGFIGFVNFYIELRLFFIMGWSRVL